jgi:ferric-dicitrate binding protein FerR (iron transport regulator)
MNLSDPEILELSRLCDAVIDRTLTKPERARLNTWLASSLEARQFYLRSMALSASLHTYASEMLSSEPEDVRPPNQRGLPFPWKWLAPFALAASVVLGFWMVHRRSADPAAGPVPEGLVARLTATKACRWSAGAMAVHLGDHLERGRSLELESGLAEITFDSGARVVLEGPSVIELDSAWGITLRQGALKATVPPQAIGFRVSNSAVEVVDLGTEFTMLADGGGNAELLVLKGTVEAEPRAGNRQDSIVLNEKESLRFSPSGISAIADSERKFARFTQPFALEPFAPAPNYAHWSFDRTDRAGFEPVVVGLAQAAHPVIVHTGMADGRESDVQGRGHRNTALRFNGEDYAVAAFPGLSANWARTVAFWVKVPADTQISEAYAMAAWLPASPRFQFHPIHIGWNRNPDEGAVGVLRVDYTRGFALGSTPLRDGRWHHVAVVFVPGAAADSPLQVKLYLDGRFEGEGRPSPPGRREDSTKSPADYTKETQDRLWLGCRLGSDGPRRNRFRGAMDELFVVDRELAPSEIVRLMTDNRLDAPRIASGMADKHSPSDQAKPW